jgi:hypothetical protein
MKKEVVKENIPHGLREYPWWVVWRYEENDGKTTKVPYNPKKPTLKAKADDLQTWGSFEQALDVLGRRNFDGIGFEFSPPYIGIDYDHVRDPITKEIDHDVMDEVMDLNSYTEISSSGTGLHVIVKGKIPGNRRKFRNREMYSEGRYFTVTGNSYTKKPKKINESQEVIDNLYEKWFGKDDTQTISSKSHKSAPNADYSAIKDAAIIKLCRQGKSSKKFNALWEGDHSDYASQSEADLALCGLIAYHTQDKEQIDRLFRRSKLYRPKWDEKHGKLTYGAMTIHKSLEGIERRRDNDDKKGELKRSLPWFEKDGNLYLEVITPKNTFEFVHLEDGKLNFEQQVGDASNLIFPLSLPIHHDSGNMIHIVGLPRANLLREVSLLTPEELYTTIDEHINKYADMPMLERNMVIYYTLYTWFYSKCPTSPYLRFIGDTGKGKSRLLQTISDLCFYPIKATGSSSSSGIMRFHERWKGTLVIDESDLKGGAEDPMIKFLNSGFERENYLILSDKVDPNRQHIFDPFGPKVLAMREPFNDAATEGRCFSYSPYETSRKDIPPELPASYHEEVERIRAHIARFILHSWQRVNEDLLIERKDLDVEPRLLQMARPVSILFQLFPKGKNSFIEYIKKRQIELRSTRGNSMAGTLFNYVFDLARGDERTEGETPKGITAKMIGDYFEKSPKSVTQILMSIGFEVERGRISIVGNENFNLKKMVRKLVVPSESIWNEMISRYYDSADATRPPKCPEILQGKNWRLSQKSLVPD